MSVIIGCRVQLNLVRQSKESGKALAKNAVCTLRHCSNLTELQCYCIVCAYTFYRGRTCMFGLQSLNTVRYPPALFIETVELPNIPNGDCVLQLSNVTADGTSMTLIVITVVIRHRTLNLNNIQVKSNTSLFHSNENVVMLHMNNKQRNKIYIYKRFTV